MERRLVLKLIAAGFAAPGLDAGSSFVSLAPLQAAASQPQFFTASEFAAVDRLSDLIIPTDEQSGGASAAKVSAYTDVMLSETSPSAQTEWRQGLQAVDAECNKRFENPFNGLTPDQQSAMLNAMAQNEGNPATAIQRFFAPLKRMTIDGYYTSKIGIHEDLRYVGNTAVAEFQGCTHPEHGA